MKHGLHVLLVEDDLDTRANLCDILELDGHRVTVAGTAREARRAAADQQFCAIILDRRLPDGNAEQILAELRQSHPSAEIIVVTGYADMDSTLTALRHGVADYILKPVNPDALRKCIEKIVQRRKIELELKQEQQFADLILSTAEAIVLVLELDGTIVRFNPYFERITGWTPEESFGKDWFDQCIPARDRERIRDVFTSTAADIETTGVVNPILTRDQRERQIRWSNTTIKGMGAAAKTILAVGVDVTDLLAAQEKALQSERLAAIGQTMTALAHESRNALQRIQSSLELLELEVGQRPEARDEIRSIQRATRDMQELLEEVRSFAAPIVLHLESSDLQKLWQRVWHQLVQVHPDRTLKLMEVVGDLDLTLSVDVTRIEQVFRNLFENALAASAGSVEVTLSCTSCDPEAVEIVVQDDGPGLTPDQLDKIFEPFYTTKSKGTGLGMSIVERLVDAHGGNIRVVALKQVEARHSCFGFLVATANPRFPSTRRSMEHERQSLLTGILEAAVDAIIVIDEHGIIQEANPATERLFGYSTDEVVGNNVNLLMPSPYRQEHDGYLAHYLATGQKKIIGIGREVVGKRKDSTTFPMHLAVSEVTVGGRKLFAGIVRDISDITRAKNRAEEIGRIIEDSLNEIFIFDAQTMKFIDVNRGARENLGYSMEELTQLTPVDIKPEQTQDSFAELIKPLVRGEKEVVQFDTEHQRKNGTLYSVEVHLQLTELEGRPCFVAIILDISERKRIEELLHEQQIAVRVELEQRVAERTQQLRETQAELVKSEKLATLGQVAGGIAHEIRNPLNAVKTSAYYLLNAQQLSEQKLCEHLERIDRQVTIIDNVVTALTDVARLPKPKLDPCDIRQIIANVADSVRIEETIAIRNELPHDLPNVRVDSNQIPIVFRNLIRNARDATQGGGTITISAAAADDRVVVRVADTGIGISPDNLRRITEPLYSTKARGMGLGLAISLAILKQNGGTMSVESELGKGTVFSISLIAESRRETDLGDDSNG